MLQRIGWFSINILKVFLSGPAAWGFVRIVVAVLIAYLVAWFDRLAVVSIAELQMSSFLCWGMWRFWVIPLIGWMAAMLVGAHYLMAIYEPVRLFNGLRYLLAGLFGIGYSSLAINEGKKKVKEGEVNLVNLIGGPGLVAVKSGNVAVLERLDAPSRICGPGAHFITRIEAVGETASLEDQHGFIESVSATTKDGIGVTVRDIHYRYRLRTGRRPGDLVQRSPANPYPFSAQAVKNMAYHRVVGKEGLGSWHSAVTNVLQGTITDYIFKHQFDPLTTPRFHEKDPREEIRDQLYSSGVRNRLRNIGAELLWVDIGHFDVPSEEVEQQRLKTWGAKWEGKANIVRVYAEAQRQRYQELGRAEAQAEILMTITHILDEVPLSASSAKNVRKLFLVKTAQILQAINDQEQDAAS